MNDIEERLRQFQPAGPPAELRSRIVSSSRNERTRGTRWLEWLPAIAAAAAAIVFYVLGQSASAAVRPERFGQDANRDAFLQNLVEQFGGDDLARFEAEQAIGQAERLAEEQRHD